MFLLLRLKEDHTDGIHFMNKTEMIPSEYMIPQLGKSNLILKYTGHFIQIGCHIFERQRIKKR